MYHGSEGIQKNTRCVIVAKRGGLSVVRTQSGKEFRVPRRHLTKAAA